MILSYTELCQIVDQGVITDVDPEAINPTSIDVRLGDNMKIETAPGRLDDRRAYNRVRLADRESVSFADWEGEYILDPMEFVLAHTLNTFNMPDDLSAEFSLKSSIARNGLEHLNACWIDAGWNGSVLTLELKNMTRHHQLVLTPGMYLGQVKFFRHAPVPAEQSYRVRGRYNGDTSVSNIKT